MGKATPTALGYRSLPKLDPSAWQCSDRKRVDTPRDKHRACPSCAGHHELSLPAPCFLSISWHKPEYGTRKLDQKDASGEISFSPPPPAGRDLGQCFLSGKGQAQRTAAKAELSARPAQTLPFYGNLATPSSHYAAPENFSFSLRFPDK